MLKLNAIAVAVAVATSSGVGPINSHGKISGSHLIGDDVNRAAIDRSSAPLFKVAGFKVAAPKHLGCERPRWQQRHQDEAQRRRDSYEV